MEIQPLSLSASLPPGPEGAGPQLQTGQVIEGKVLAAGPQGAQIQISGRTVAVQTDVPLHPGDQLTLKVGLVNGGQIKLTVLGLQGTTQSLMSDTNLTATLEQMGMPTTGAYRDAARTVFAESGSVDPSWVREVMRQAPADRQAAAFLLARKLPVTPETIALARKLANPQNFGAQLGQALNRAMQDPRLPARLLTLALPENADAQTLTQALQDLAQSLTPPEAELAKALATAAESASSSPETGTSPGPGPSRGSGGTGSTSTQPTSGSTGSPGTAASTGSPTSTGSPGQGGSNAALVRTMLTSDGATSPVGASSAFQPAGANGQTAGPASGFAEQGGAGGTPGAGAAGAGNSGTLAGSAGQGPATASLENLLSSATLPAGLDGPASGSESATTGTSTAPATDGGQADSPAGSAAMESAPGSAASLGGTTETIPQLPAAVAQRLASNLVVALETAIAQDASAEPKTPPQGAPPSTAASVEGAQVASTSGLQDLAQGIRYQQLINSAAAQAPQGGQEVRLPLLFGKHRGELMVQTWKGNARDPEGHARVVVALDMTHLGPVKVDVMYARGQVTGHVTVADAATRDFVAERLSELKDGITGVGIGVGHLEVGTAQAEQQGLVASARYDVRL